MREAATVLTVTQLNTYIKNLMDGDGLLRGVYVRGEISNYKAYPSGHHYFSVKDGESAVRCVMFRHDASSLRFRPENGMKVTIFGRVTVFPRDGQYQLYCSKMTPDGVGDLHVAFEQLKEKLTREGLFDVAHKKPLPAYPQTIALVTSPAGAAVQDMLRVLGARWPSAKVVVIPVLVQGVDAPPEICRGLDYANRHQLADVIIVGRGGGSMEDLWAFNDENVARAIYRSTIPVISAVGHEPDVTIADYVADVRGATPSNGAELAVPDRVDVAMQLVGLSNRMGKAMGNRVEKSRDKLDNIAQKRVMSSPIYFIADKRMLLDFQQDKLTHGMVVATAKQREKFGAMAAKLDALSPLKVLGRGYAITKTGDDRVVTSVEQVSAGDVLQVAVTDGTIQCRVEEKERQQWQKKS